MLYLICIKFIFEIINKMKFIISILFCLLTMSFDYTLQDRIVTLVANTFIHYFPCHLIILTRQNRTCVNSGSYQIHSFKHNLKYNINLDLLSVILINIHIKVRIESSLQLPFPIFKPYLENKKL